MRRYGRRWLPSAERAGRPVERAAAA
jgi:hypothetical protein